MTPIYYLLTKKNNNTVINTFPWNLNNNNLHRWDFFFKSFCENKFVVIFMYLERKRIMILFSINFEQKYVFFKKNVKLALPPNNQICMTFIRLDKEESKIIIILLIRYVRNNSNKNDTSCFTFLPSKIKIIVLSEYIL